METPWTATAAGGTHPTGMHSCFLLGVSSHIVLGRGLFILGVAVTQRYVYRCCHLKLFLCVCVYLENYSRARSKDAKDITRGNQAFLPSAAKLRRLCFYRCLSTRGCAPGGVPGPRGVPGPGGVVCLVLGGA